MSSADVKSSQDLTALAAAAAQAAPRLSALGRAAKDRFLLDLAGRIEAQAESLMAANAQDVAAAKAKGTAPAFVDRLTLSPKVIAGLVQGLKDVAALPDPVGEVTGLQVRPNGLRVGRMRVPLGVIAFIYESRPNTTVDAAALCLKAGNAIVLKGGSEAIRSNLALGGLIRESLLAAGLPEAAAQVVARTDHEAVRELLKLSQYIDLVIPRGGEGLIRLVAQEARMPVLKHYKGVCHLYVDDKADLSMAVELAYNGKVQRPGVCNALECLLVHRGVAREFLPLAAERLGRAKVRIRGCPETRAILPQAEAATEEDFHTEYLDLVISARVVAGLDEAMAHIAQYGSRHTDSICTTDYDRAMKFLREVDASVVLVNASTRFNDGGELGLGAEIGISTDKLHAYGPMGLNELTTTKFIVLGQGQVRE